ncbi:hypothetical protein DKX38_009033 [Salix brachista]|uniref:Uncharacterized protein n=1 Tax=Salix brachista TaxID=2182728 RepID=A0A5N5MA13_9ROSI|nr:hypothetical protein DKX38_009033 [Salix brachista]
MGETQDSVTRKVAGDEWLRLIMNKGEETRNSGRAREGPKIPSNSCREFQPMVVVIGPYEYGYFECRCTASDKMKMACQFVQDSGISVEILYNKVADVASKARKFYDELSLRRLSNEKFTQMLFLDGCFILQFLFSFLRKPQNLNMFLVEDVYYIKLNLLSLSRQLPFPVLQSLMSLRFKEEEGMELINDFIDHIRAVPPQQGSSKEAIGKSVRCYIWSPLEQESQDQPAHLFELFHRKLINNRKVIDHSQSRTWHASRSAKDLKATGIRFRPNRTNDLTDVKFKSTVLGGILELPRFTIDVSSESLLLQLMEYERVVHTSGELWVTSYICFLDALIQDAEDVKVLRSEGILFNNLGGDQQVADLIHKMAKHQLPNRRAYSDARQRIGSHHKGINKEWIAERLRVYLTNLWIFIAISAAIFWFVQ